MKKTWKTTLDHEGDHTYKIDFSKEMTNLGHTLQSVALTLSTAATAAGLVVSSENIVGDVYYCKFSIPNVSNQDFSSKGQTLDMEVIYTSSGGEVDAFTASIHIKDK